VGLLAVREADLMKMVMLLLLGENPFYMRQSHNSSMGDTDTVGGGVKDRRGGYFQNIL